MDVQMRQCPADQPIARDAHDLVVQVGVELGKARIAQPGLPAVQVAHPLRRFRQPAHALGADAVGRTAGRGRFEQEAEVVELVEIQPRDLRRGAVADEMGLDHQPLALQPPERFADGGLGHLELPHKAIDRDPRARRDLQGQELVENRSVDVIGQPLVPLNNHVASEFETP